jgi:hypothetical protein
VSPQPRLGRCGVVAEAPPAGGGVAEIAPPVMALRELPLPEMPLPEVLLPEVLLPEAPLPEMALPLEPTP